MFKKLSILFATSLLSTTHAKDLGVQGAMFEIKEQSLLELIYARLRTLESTNKLVEHQKEIQARVKSSIENPLPISGIKTATFYVSRNYAPSIIIDEDIKDHKGNTIVLKGTQLNPLDYHAFGKPLVFIKGDDATQVEWALKQGTKDTSVADTRVGIVLVSGKPLHLARTHNKTFFFDQGGVLVKKFGITHVPAKVSQFFKVLKVEEIPLKESSRVLQKISLEVKEKK